MSKYSSFKSADIARIRADENRIKYDMIRAYNQHGPATMARVQDIVTACTADDRYQRIFAVVKAILSAGMHLIPNIAVARFIADAFYNGEPLTYDDIDTFARGFRYYSEEAKRTKHGAEARSFGVNVHYVLSQRNIIVALTHDNMVYDYLITLKGLGPKTVSWALSVYFGNVRRFTLDVHMYRGIAGTGTATTARIHCELEQMLLEWCDEVLPGIAPLAIQWAMWTVYRGVSFDSHSGICRSDDTRFAVMNMDTMDVVAQFDTEQDALAFMAYEPDSELLYVSPERL